MSGRRRYRFIGFISSESVEGGIYVWESTEAIPGDSRVEQVRCPRDWFWQRAPSEPSLAFTAPMPRASLVGATS